MRNFVSKNDFNRASYHRDKKNDYNRKWDIEEVFLPEYHEEDDTQHGNDSKRIEVDGKK